MIRLFVPIYLLALLYGIFAESIAEKIVIYFQPSVLEQDTIDDFSGIFELSEDLLLSKPHAEWPAFLKRLSSKNIPAKITLVSDYHFDAHAMEQMKKGVPWYDGERDIIYKQLGETQHVLSFGPVETIEALQLSEAVAALSGGVLLVAIIVVWTLTVQRRIKILEDSTRRFGMGDLSSRVSENNDVRVSNLNRHFNQMANRIQNLIESNKHLTNAVAHELRSPLGHIRFELDFLREETDSLSVKQSCDSIEDDLNTLDALLDEMLTYAKFDREHMEISLTTVDVVAWVKGWFASKKAKATTAVELSCEPINADIALDSSSFARALDNIFQNAVKYGNHHVKISVGRAKDNIAIRFEDDGDGISVDDRDSLFEPFYRLDSSRTRSTGGYGMGLAIVKKIIEQHHAVIEVEDSKLGGASFTILLPIDVSRP